jgi:hypothetical protein
MQDAESIPEQTSRVTAVNSSNWRRTAIAVVITALVTGTSGYLLGIRTNQNTSQSTQQVSFRSSPITPTATPTVPVLPTEIPALTANWKTYTNARWGLSFKYPEEWFPQEVPSRIPPGDIIYFYPYGVTPDVTGAGIGAVLVVSNQSYSEQDIKQIISYDRQTYGNRVLKVAGKPAIKGVSHYIIKLSSTRLLILSRLFEDVAKRLDTVVSTIKFTNE